MPTWKNLDSQKCRKLEESTNEKRRKGKNDYDETKNEFVIFILNEET